MKFPKLVIEEAKALREFATEEEKNRLDFDTFKPDDDRRCIYGQMTGHCFSARAANLIEKSCKRVYEYQTIPARTTENQLNGTPMGKDRHSYWSPIEVFIARDANPEANERLIQFIKGEIKSL